MRNPKRTRINFPRPFSDISHKFSYLWIFYNLSDLIFHYFLYFLIFNFRDSSLKIFIKCNLYHFSSSSRNLSADIFLNSPFSCLLYASSVLLANAISSLNYSFKSFAFFKRIVFSSLIIRNVSPSLRSSRNSEGITICPLELIFVSAISIGKVYLTIFINVAVAFPENFQTKE